MTKPEIVDDLLEQKAVVRPELLTPEATLSRFDADDPDETEGFPLQLHRQLEEATRAGLATKTKPTVTVEEPQGLSELIAALPGLQQALSETASVSTMLESVSNMLKLHHEQLHQFGDKLNVFREEITDLKNRVEAVEELATKPQLELKVPSALQSVVVPKPKNAVDKVWDKGNQSQG